MSLPPQPRVPHVRDNLIVANVGLGTFAEAAAHLHAVKTSKVGVEK